MLRLSSTHLLYVFFPLVLLGVAVAGQEAGSQPQTPTLTKTARKALDEKYKGWQLAPVDPQSATCAADGVAPASFVQADFNSDGQMDTAVLLKTADGLHLVALLNRMEDSVVVDVDSLGSSGGSLRVEKRGSRFKNPDDTLDDYFTADTLAVYRCGQPRTVYFWAGAGFRKAVLAK